MPTRSTSARRPMVTGADVLGVDIVRVDLDSGSARSASPDAAQSGLSTAAMTEDGRWSRFVTEPGRCGPSDALRGVAVGGRDAPARQVADRVVGLAEALSVGGCGGSAVGVPHDVVDLVDR